MSDLHFHVNEVPSPPSIMLFGLQQMMICLSSLLVIPYVVSDMLCAGDQALQIRVQLISATFVTSGIATILQTTFGMRLSILHGPSFAFLPALHTFQATFPCNADTNTNNWEEKMQMISGSCLIAVLIMPILGFTGLVGKISKYIGPVTIVPIMSLLTIGTVPDIEEKMSLHWISIVEFLTLILFVVILERYEVPLPVFSLSEKRFKFTRQKIFSQFPYLLGISIVWFICFIMTITNAEPRGGEARTDQNASITVFDQTPWVQMPMPLFFGPPKFNLALVCGFMASCFAAMIESIGDYNLCAKISKQSRPPQSNTNRAFVVEGVGCILAALWGVGTGVTTYAENIAIMSVTKVTSRITMQMAGVLLILAGVISKFAAFLSMIPEPIIGGLLAMGVCLINGVSLSNLQTVDMKISRNLTIIGISIIMGLTVATHFEKTPLNTGNQIVDDVFGTLLTIRMLIGGVIAFTLDNITGGATRRQRGFVSEMDDEEQDPEKGESDIETNGYVLPSKLNQFFLRYSWLTYLPVIPSEREIREIEEKRNKFKIIEEKIEKA
ncbi:Protein CBG08364 [Caenorhabditis briggsae]|uniref:Uncharacterized protein n=2 Tax=Caenorhabditis briggsae TaxID=6238 RepID=A0AAE9EYT2_CAEBR|nr:Protein CBG08364 [Caenorhabditis briggsae]ULT97114.1 hypothetical protein L3Y34_005144 [Caenorhabditis briggsae]UMM30293.1 hypothetical protein L5515_012234 [Caenorhabditis briggsae]CAP28201.1 Protein CBG08364 [Caenorhabditis briggsae]